MELWQLRTFSAVAKNLHFTRAAEELNLSQPAVSHQIKSLEEEIGEPLFLREKQGVSLTKAGHTMYQHANKILDIADEMRLEIKENEDVLSGKIILGVVTRGLGNPFPIIYRDFKKLYPDIEVAVQVEYKLEDVIEKVIEGKIDIGMVSHNPDLKGLVEVPYGEYELLFAVGKEHRLAQRDEISADELQNEEWIMFEPGNRFRQSTDKCLTRAGIRTKNIYETNDGSLIRTMLIHGNKIALLPEWGIFEELQDGKIVSVKVKDVKCKIQINLIWKASRRTKLMSAVLSFLLEEKLAGINSLNSEKVKKLL
jgi:LysR family cyn operon transcriptional activator